MSAQPSKQPQLLSEVRHALRWRTKRLLQYLRVRYQSWKTPEVCLAGVTIPLSDYISDNVRDAMFHGGYESAELRTITDNLSADDRVLEIGTGIGLISTFCAKKIGSDRVFTFEANPELEPYIREVYRRNDVSPQLEIAVLGAEDGEASFFVHNDYWSSSLVQRATDARQVTVPRKHLNRTIEQIQPTFLIMDIEGGESDLFQHIDLTPFRKIAIELHTSVLGRERIEQIRQQLDELGFKVNWRYSSVIDGFKEELYLERG